MVRALRPLLILLLLTVPSTAAAAPTQRIIVKREAGARGAEIRADAGVTLVRRLGIERTQLVRARDPRAALEALRADPGVEYAFANLTAHAATLDPLYDQQWALETATDADMDVPEAWARSTGAGQTVAVVDTGVDLDHVDLVDKLVPGFDYLGPNVPDPGAGPLNWHGTHVAGIVGAERDNGEGIAGVAPDAKVKPLRVLNSSGSGPVDAILTAFDDAGAAGVRVVSGSLVLDPITDPETQAGLRAAFNDVMGAHPRTLYVVAAGNHGVDADVSQAYPCAATAANLVCVGAADRAGARASFSNYGRAAVDLFAPGVHIVSTMLDDTYAERDGTSMATPQVSGIAALVFAAAPQLTGDDVRRILVGTVDVRPGLARSVSGGRPNAGRALAALAADGDADKRPALVDNCPTLANTTQADGDGDGLGDPCDADRDGDGRTNSADRCPDSFGTGADGCPPPPPLPADADGDGRIDGLDACPAEAAGTVTGCPVPALRTLTTKVDGRRAKVRVEADRAAHVLFKIERRRCRDEGCRWKRIVREEAVAPTGGVTLKLTGLRLGRYRATVRLSSEAGRSPYARETFRIRR